MLKIQLSEILTVVIAYSIGVLHSSTPASQKLSYAGSFAHHLTSIFCYGSRVGVGILARATLKWSWRGFKELGENPTDEDEDEEDNDARESLPVPCFNMK